MNKQKTPSFLIEIKDTKHSSWQGVVTWIDGNKKENFRSALELIRMLDSTIAKDEEEME